jgi:hypothetical protein
MNSNEIRRPNLLFVVDTPSHQASVHLPPQKSAKLHSTDEWYSDTDADKTKSVLHHKGIAALEIKEEATFLPRPSLEVRVQGFFQENLEFLQVVSSQ